MNLKKQLAAERAGLVFSVISVYSGVTTSHSTRLSKDASQVAGYVA